ncbi:radical SAM protein [Nocardia gipuzkoensis]
MQPTTLCNLNCTYCYLPDRKQSKRMSVEVAEAVAVGVGQWSEQHPVTMLWHGGEPLVVDPDYFRALVEPFGSGVAHPITHAVQTNATRIDETWCEVFADVPVRVTVSIDGPDEVNDSRLDWSGRPSAARAMRGIDTLRRAGISFSMIAVVSDLSPGSADRLYRRTAVPARSTSWKEFCAMPNTPAPEKDVESTVTLTERIEASRDALTEASAQAGERYDSAGIFGW